jgi:uncharacterized membrane protein
MKDNEKIISRVISAFYFISALLVILGAFFRLQHYPHGYSILILGFILGTIISTAGNSRLKKKIKQLEDQIKSN